MNLRKLAKGRECQVRIPLVCNHDDSTVVLAHFRRGGVAGTGQKPPDLCGAWACSACHDEIDGRTRGLIQQGYPEEEAKFMIVSAMLDGLNRTLAALSREIGIGNKAR
jgi:hypothetical protein